MSIYVHEKEKKKKRFSSFETSHACPTADLSQSPGGQNHRGEVGQDQRLGDRQAEGGEFTAGHGSLLLTHTHTHTDRPLGVDLDLFCCFLQMEQENQQLKAANLQQTEQIVLLQDKLQGERCCDLSRQATAS